MTFDLIAPFYDRLAHLVFGQTLEQAQLSLLNRLPRGGRWLLLGGGTGWLLEQVINRCQPESVLYLEASGEMLKLAQKRIDNQPYNSRIEFMLGTESTLPETDSFDSILTPFVLDLFSENWLENSMIPRLLNALKPGGYWLVTDFVPTSVWWQRVLAKSMLLFFRLTTGLRATRLPDWGRLLQKKMTLIAETRSFNGMIRSELFRQAPEKD